MKLAIVGSHEFENYDLLCAADCVLAFVALTSKCTWDTIRKAEKMLKKVIIVRM